MSIHPNRGEHSPAKCPICMSVCVYVCLCMSLYVCECLYTEWDVVKSKFSCCCQRPHHYAVVSRYLLIILLHCYSCSSRHCRMTHSDNTDNTDTLINRKHVENANLRQATVLNFVRSHVSCKSDFLLPVSPVSDHFLAESVAESIGWDKTLIWVLHFGLSPDRRLAQRNCY